MCAWIHPAGWCDWLVDYVYELRIEPDIENEHDHATREAPWCSSLGYENNYDVGALQFDIRAM